MPRGEVYDNPYYDERQYQLWLEEVQGKFQRFSEEVKANPENKKTLNDFLQAVLGISTIPIDPETGVKAQEEVLLIKYILSDLAANSAKTFVHHSTSGSALKRRMSFFSRGEIEHSRRTGKVFFLRPVTLQQMSPDAQGLSQSVSDSFYAGVIFDYTAPSIPSRRLLKVYKESSRFTFEQIFDAITEEVKKQV